MKDSASVMVRWDHGFVVLVEDKKDHSVMKFHRIIHQESLCATIPKSSLATVIATTTKFVNFIVAHSASTHWQFHAFLDEMESAHRDFPLHCISRWLSCSKVLVKVVKCLDVINLFLSNQGKHPELNDEKWLVDLLFLADITTHSKRIKSSCARCWWNNIESFWDVEIFRIQTWCLFSRCLEFHFLLFQKSSKIFVWS